MNGSARIIPPGAWPLEMRAETTTAMNSTDKSQNTTRVLNSFGAQSEATAVRSNHPVALARSSGAADELRHQDAARSHRQGYVRVRPGG